MLLFRLPLQTEQTIFADFTGSDIEKNTTKVNDSLEGPQTYRQVSINEEVTTIDVETPSW